MEVQDRQIKGERKRTMNGMSGVSGWEEEEGEEEDDDDDGLVVCV